MLRRLLGSVRRYGSNHDRKWTYKTLPTPDEGTVGEKQPQLALPSFNRESMLVTEENLNKIYDGLPYDQLPVCDIKVSKNNTIMTLSPQRDAVSMLRSCGMEGFKNTRKGTNIAAQATAISFSGMILDKGISTLRVRVSGLGPGRLAAIKGLQMGGINIVSITDRTKVSWNPLRPRKARRL